MNIVCFKADNIDVTVHGTELIMQTQAVILYS